MTGGDWSFLVDVSVCSLVVVGGTGSDVDLPLGGCLSVVLRLVSSRPTLARWPAVQHSLVPSSSGICGNEHPSGLAWGVLKLDGSVPPLSVSDVASSDPKTLSISSEVG